jgi:hypothetical protein
VDNLDNLEWEIYPTTLHQTMVIFGLN